MALPAARNPTPTIVGRVGPVVSEQVSLAEGNHELHPNPQVSLFVLRKPADDD
jgi:hypothetical protein